MTQNIINFREAKLRQSARACEEASESRCMCCPECGADGKFSVVLTDYPHLDISEIAAFICNSRMCKGETIITLEEGAEDGSCA